MLYSVRSMYSIVIYSISEVVQPANMRKGRMSFPRHLLRGLCGRFSCGSAPLGLTEFEANAAQGIVTYGVLFSSFFLFFFFFAA